MFDFIDLRTSFVIFHLFAVILGAGSAFMTDVIFMYSAKDKVLDKKEFQFVSLGSKMVWFGILLIILSGALLFILAPERLIESTKFQAKMTIIAILIINGIVFHKIHLPFLKTQIDKKLTTSKEFIKRSKGLFVSGAISTTSWLSALLLGVLWGIPYPYWIIMSVYLLLVLIAVLFSFLARIMFLKIN